MSKSHEFEGKQRSACCFWFVCRAYVFFYVLFLFVCFVFVLFFSFFECLFLFLVFGFFFLFVCLFVCFVFVFVWVFLFVCLFFPNGLNLCSLLILWTHLNKLEQGGDRSITPPPVCLRAAVVDDMLQIARGKKGAHH